MELKVHTQVKTTFESIDIVLNHDEAKALKAVLGQVGGHPSDSPRGLLDPLYNKLATSLGDSNRFSTAGTITFDNYTYRKAPTGI